jgi:hypothetical protein
MFNCNPKEPFMALLASTYDQSRFFRADDLTQDKVLKIKSVTEELVSKGNNQEKKLVVWFTNSPKGLVLNRTNNRTIRGAYGDDVAGWVGKLIVLYPTQTELGGRPVGALRVRIPPPKQAKPSDTLNNSVAPPAQEAAKPAAVTKPAPASLPEPELEPDLDDEIPL